MRRWLVFVLVVLTVASALPIATTTATGGSQDLPDAPPLAFPSPMSVPELPVPVIPPPDSGVRDLTGIEPTIGLEPMSPPSGTTPNGSWETLPDGTRKARVYSSPVNWQSVDGAWHAIDRTLQANGDGRIGATSAAPGTTASFATTSTGALVWLPTAAGEISMGYVGQVQGIPGNIATDGYGVEYPAALAGSDVHLKIASSGVHDDVVLSNALGSPTHQVVFTVPAGVTAAEHDGAIEFSHDAEVVAFYAGGIAFDSAATRSETRVNVALVSQQGTTVIVNVAIDPTWLLHLTRAFPVTIDPGFYTNTNNYTWGGATGGFDTYVNSDACSYGTCTPTSGYPCEDAYSGDTILRVGYPDSGQTERCSTPGEWPTFNPGAHNRTRTFVKYPFDQVVPTTYSYKVYNATFGFYAIADAYNYGGSKTYELMPNDYVNPAWSSIRWYNQPLKLSTGLKAVASWNDTPDAFKCFGDCSEQLANRDPQVLALVQWYLDRTDVTPVRPNYGYQLRAADETATGTLRTIASNENAPKPWPYIDLYYNIPPAAPTITSIAPEGTNGIHVQWNPVDWADANAMPPVTRGFDAFLYDAANNQQVDVKTASEIGFGAHFTGLTPGHSYYAKVRAVNVAGPGPIATSASALLPQDPTFTKYVATVDVNGTVDCTAPTSTFPPVGSTVAFCLKVTNPNPVAISATVSDTVPGTTPIEGVPVLESVIGILGPCAYCTVTGNQVDISSFSVAANASKVFVVPTVPLDAGSSCKQVSNTAQLTSVTPAAPYAATATVCSGGLGLEPWWSYADTSVGPQAAAHVNVANGNLVVEHIDSTPVPAHGRLSYVLRRVYNSQDTTIGSLPGSIGAGWRFSLGAADDLTGLGVEPTALSVPQVSSALSPLSVSLVDRDGTRHVFTTSAVSGFTPLDVTGLPASLSTLAPRVLTGGSIVPSGKHVCVDQLYTPPAGVHLSLWRYVRVATTTQCSSLTTDTSRTVLGFASERPDRLRSEYSANGALLSVIDGAGVELRYKYAFEPIPGQALGNLTAVYEPDVCADPSVTTCRAMRFDYSQANVIAVTDPAGRTTTYHQTGGRLTSVDNPDGTTLTYTYGSACSGSANQLCSMTDPKGQTTQFAYTAAPMGLPRISTVTDRRSNATTFSYTDGSGGTPTFTTVDAGTHRRRFESIDTAGRVGTIHEGLGTNAFPHETTFTWDTTSAGCRQPADNIADNNLCAVSRTNAVGLPDELTQYTFNPEGGLLRSRRVNGASNVTTTYGYRAQYTSTTGTVATFDDTVAGSGNVTSQAGTGA